MGFKFSTLHSTVIMRVSHNKKRRNSISRKWIASPNTLFVRLYSSIQQNWSDPTPSRADSDFLGPWPETEMPFCTQKDVGESENTNK